MPFSMRRPGGSAVLAALALLAVSLAAACGGDDGPAGSAATVAATSTGAASTDGPRSEHGQLIARAAIPIELAEGTAIGRADAPVVIEAFEDFGCPHCLHFTATIEPHLFEEYVARGKVRFVYRYFPLQQVTGLAAIAAQCAAEQDRFWGYHKLLFIAQAEANNKSGPGLGVAFGPEGLRSLAAEAGLDSAAFEACVAGDAAFNIVQGDLREANSLGLRGTPSFVINGEVLGGNPETFDEWKKVLDPLLK
jgi:protein-disulfide isomerase